MTDRQSPYLPPSLDADPSPALLRAFREPVRVALVGCGAVAREYYAPALAELSGRGWLRVAAIHDPVPANAVYVQRQFPGARRIGQFAGVLSAPVELAIVSSPPRFHAEQTIQLLGAGMSVLCEKPMAMTVAEAEAMIAAAGRAPGVLAIGLFRRFFPATQMIHQILSDGLLGDITDFSFSEGDTFRWPIQSPSYFARGSGNGVLMDLGAHLLDLMLWWMGEPERIAYDDDAMGGIEVNARIRCQFSDGRIGDVRLSRDCRLPNRYVIRGTKAWLAWEVNEASSVELGLNDGPMMLRGEVHGVQVDATGPTRGGRGRNFHQTFARQIVNVAAAARGAELPLVPGTEGIRGLRLIEACYRRRSPMPMPWLDSREQAAVRNGS
jgi:predicted dehydrogenase